MSTVLTTKYQLWRQHDLSKGITFRVWFKNVADSLTNPLTTPGVNLSCFGAGSDIGDKGPLVSSAKCFNEFREFPCGNDF